MSSFNHARYLRRRDELKEALRREGIDTMIHDPVPPHLSDAYPEDGWKPGAFPTRR